MRFVIHHPSPQILSLPIHHSRCQKRLQPISVAHGPIILAFPASLGLCAKWPKLDIIPDEALSLQPLLPLSPPSSSSHSFSLQHPHTQLLPYRQHSLLCEICQSSFSSVLEYYRSIKHHTHPILIDLRLPFAPLRCAHFCHVWISCWRR